MDRKVTFSNEVKLIKYERLKLTKQETSWSFIARTWDDFDYNCAQHKWALCCKSQTTDSTFARSECPCCRTMYKSDEFVYSKQFCCIKCDQSWNPNPYNPHNFELVKIYLPHKWQDKILPSSKE